MSKKDVRDRLHACEKRKECFHPETRSEACSAARMLRAQELVRPMPGLYARASYWGGLGTVEQHCHMARALSRMHPGWTFCSVTAAALWGFEPSEELLGRIHVIPGNDRNHGSPRIEVHEIRHPERELLGAVPLTSRARTAYDCARRLSFTEGLIIVDAAFRAMGWPRERLLAHARLIGRTGSSRGYRHALITISYASPLSESGLESIARASMIRLGMAVPQLQAELPNLMGGQSYRVDFLWSLPDGGLVIGEADGCVKYEDRRMNLGDPLAKLLAERQRESRLTALGIPIMRVTRSIARDPRALERLMRAFGIPRVRDPCTGPEMNPGDGW